MIGKKVTPFNYTLPWSKSYNFVDTKYLTIISFNKVEEPQITDTDFMVTTHSGQLSRLIKIRYWKIVVSERGIWTSPNTTKNGEFYRNVISPGSKMTEWTKNKWTCSAATFLGKYFWSYKLVSNKPITIFQNKTVNNDLWKIKMSEIPSIIKEKSVRISRPKHLLLTGINQFKTTQAAESYWKDILM